MIAALEDYRTLWITCAFLAIVSFAYPLIARREKSREKSSLPLTTRSAGEFVKNLFSTNAHAFFLEMIREAGNAPVLRLPVGYPGAPFLVVVSDFRIARIVMEDPRSTKWAIAYQFFDLVVGGDNMFAAEGNRAKHPRKATAMAFSTESCKRMVGIINSAVDEWMSDVLEQKYVNTDETLDILDTITNLTCDIILLILLDCKLPQDEREHVKICLKVAYEEFSQRSQLNPFRKFWVTGWMFPEVRKARQATRELYRVGRSVLQTHRAKKNADKSSVLYMIDKNPEYRNDDERIRDLLIYFVGSFDTTSSSLAWIFVELARHVDEQTKLRNELRACNSEDAKLNNAMLKRVIRETMRLRPAAALGSLRIAPTDVAVPESTMVIPAKTVCFFPFFVIHRNPSCFPNPDVFDPSRWENPSQEMLQSFLPFACGRRNCQGQALANAEVSIILARLVEKYEFTIVDEGRAEFNVVLRMVGTRLKRTCNINATRSNSLTPTTMAKDKKKKKDPEKKAALQAKKEAKADKSARKRIQKEGLGSGNNDSPDAELDDLLQAYRRKYPDVQATVFEPLETDFPAARANASFTLAEDSNKIYLFGGEYYDGVENVVVDELIQFDINKLEWKRVITPQPRPGTRCAHSTIYYKQALYVFGGEFATAESYHHFKDVWKFDLKEKKWIELSPHKGTAATPPTARSGHAAFVWKNYMIVFGGFYEAQKDTKWYQDVHVLDLLTEKWMQLPEPSRLSSRPEPRSACNVAVLTDAAVIQGGFSKLKKTAAATPMGATSSYESKVHTDAWKLHLLPLLQNKPPTWERLPHIKSNSLTLTPLGRAGMSSVTYKNQLLAWGGVCDTEHHHHVMQSVFYNDLWAMDLEKRKWYPVRIQDKKADQSDKQRRRRRRKHPQAGTTNDSAGEANEETNEEDGDDEKGSDEEFDNEEEEAVESADMNQGWDLDKLRSNMFAFIDASGNMVYEKIAEEGVHKIALSGEVGNDDEKDEEKEEEKGDDEEEEEIESDIEMKFSRISFSKDLIDSKADHAAAAKDSSFKTLTSSSVMILNPETRLPEPVVGSEPLPRINAELVLYGNTVYMYGGLLEVGDREVTLDDLWRLDLRKRDKWECVYPGTMHKQVWRGATHDDDDSYVSTGADDDDENDDDDDDGDDEEGGNEEDDDGTDTLEVDEAQKNEPAVPSKEKKKSKRSTLRHEIANLNEQNYLNDSNQTPLPGEAVAEFYARTSEYWNEQAAAAAQREGHEPLSTKELRRDGFNLARKRLDDLKPIMDRLNELDLLYQEAGQEKKERKDDRDEKKLSRRYR